MYMVIIYKKADCAPLLGKTEKKLFTGVDQK